MRKPGPSKEGSGHFPWTKRNPSPHRVKHRSTTTKRVSSGLSDSRKYMSDAVDAKVKLSESSDAIPAQKSLTSSTERSPEKGEGNSNPTAVSRIRHIPWYKEETNNRLQSNTMEVFFKSLERSQGTWRMVGRGPDRGICPSARSRHHAVYVNCASANYRGMYIVGGDDGTRLNDVWMYMANVGRWVRVDNPSRTPAPLARYYHSASAYDTDIWVFGGFNDENENSNSLWKFSVVQREWEQVHAPNPPMPRSGHTSFVHKGILYVLGGFDGARRLDDFHCIHLDRISEGWKRVEEVHNPNSSRPSGRCNFASAVVQDRVYIFSGHAGTLSTNDLWYFDFEEHRWSEVYTVGPAPNKRNGHTMCASENGQLVVFGGGHYEASLNDCWVIDVRKTPRRMVDDPLRWTLVKVGKNARCPSGRSFHAAVVIAGDLIVHGGSPLWNAYVSDVWHLTLPALPPMDSYLEQQTSLLDTHPNAAILRVRCPRLLQTPREISRETLEFVYTDDFVSATNATVEHLFQVCQEAIELDLPRLLALARRYVLQKVLCADHVIEALKLAEGVDAQLRDACKLYIVRNYDDILSGSNLETLPPNVLVDLMRLEREAREGISSGTGGLHTRLSLERDDEHASLEMSPPGSGSTSPSHNSRVSTIKKLDAENPFVGVPPSSIRSDMLMLITPPLLDSCDVILRVEEGELHAHQAIIAAHSSYFRAYFEWALRDKPAPKPGDPLLVVDVKLDEIVPSMSALHALVRFMYSGQVESLDVNDAVLLLPATGYFGLHGEGLMYACLRTITDGLHQQDPTAMIRTLTVSYTMRMADLYKAALGIAQKHWNIISHHRDELMGLNKEILLDLLDLPVSLG